MIHIIFHHPLPLNQNAKSASGIRPLRMLKAFQDLGYEVDIVAGYAKERKKAIKHIKNKIKKGIRYDFVYAESSTMPTTLTEPHHFPTHPLMDWLFFSFCKKQNIPIGLFYRDIYWLFSEYGKGLHPIKTFFAKVAFRFDLWVYEKTLTKLYLPSLEMGKYVPKVSKDKFSALPPGHITHKSERKKIDNNQEINLFYVGGISDHYQLHLLFEVLKNFPKIKFTLCTREEEWQNVKDSYPSPSKNITIIHKTGKEMENHLKNCDIAVLYVKPQEYREFAVPVKLFEYIGFKKPILTSNSTLAGKFVAENNIGWSLDYDKTTLHNFFENLMINQISLKNLETNLEQVAKMHSWQSRTQQVINDLK